ncbi:MAG: alpha/beta fold hydrolase [Treponema sp.]|nr:alpha/beta fold hydrolase [Treponema sp.]
MIHLGFSYVGIVYLAMLFIPNIIWAKNKPRGYDDFAPHENRTLLALERAGECLVCVFVLVFSDFNLRFGSDSFFPDILFLIVSSLFMILYEVFWVRYFRSGRTMRDFYSSLLGIPVAGASLPVIAFFFLGIYGRNGFLLAAVLVLGIGHIGIHLGHRKEVLGMQDDRRNPGGSPNLGDGLGTMRVSPRNTRDRLCKLGYKLLALAKRAGVLILCLIAVILATYFLIRNVIFMKGTVNQERGICEEAYIDIGGQELFVRIRGRDKSNPVVIHLHGGPGSPDACIGYTFMDPLLDKATFVTWDQRGCGRSYIRNRKADPGNESATFDQALADLDALVDYARGRFSKEKVIIEGHSYGTFLGTAYVMSNPDKVAAYISIGQCTMLREGEILSCEDALYKAATKGDDTMEMREACEAYAADSTFFNLIALRNFTERYHKPPVMEKSMLCGALSPYFNLTDARWMFGLASSPEKLYALNGKLLDHLLASSIYDFGTRYQVPVLFISGEHDWVTPRGLVEQYCETVTAPSKKLVVIPRCGHSPQTDRPADVVQAIRAFLGEVK